MAGRSGKLKKGKGKKKEPDAPVRIEWGGKTYLGDGVRYSDEKTGMVPPSMVRQQLHGRRRADRNDTAGGAG